MGRMESMGETNQIKAAMAFKDEYRPASHTLKMMMVMMMERRSENKQGISKEKPRVREEENKRHKWTWEIPGRPEEVQETRKKKKKARKRWRKLDREKRSAKHGTQNKYDNEEQGQIITSSTWRRCSTSTIPSDPRTPSALKINHIVVPRSSNWSARSFIVTSRHGDKNAGRQIKNWCPTCGSKKKSRNQPVNMNGWI